MKHSRTFRDTDDFAPSLGLDRLLEPDEGQHGIQQEGFS